MSNRPFGVLVLGSLAIAIAIVKLVIGFQLLFGDRLEASGVGWVGLLTIIVAVIYLAVGWALWSMRPWALLFTMIMAVFGLVDAMFVLLATNNIAYGLAAAAIPAFLLWYCSREDIRAAFDVSGSGGR